jgi:hypothetical protein
VAHQLNPSFDIFKGKESRYRMFDLGCGTDTIRKALMEDFDFDRIKPIWERDAAKFKAESQKYYLY